MHVHFGNIVCKLDTINTVRIISGDERAMTLKKGGEEEEQHLSDSNPGYRSRKIRMKANNPWSTLPESPLVTAIRQAFL